VLSSLRYLNREMEPCGGERVVEIEAVDLTGTIIPLHTVSLMVAAPIRVENPMADSGVGVESDMAALAGDATAPDPPIDWAGNAVLDGPAEAPDGLDAAFGPDRGAPAPSQAGPGGLASASADADDPAGRRLGDDTSASIEFFDGDRSLIGDMAVAFQAAARAEPAPDPAPGPAPQPGPVPLGDIVMVNDGAPFLGEGFVAFRPAGAVAGPGEAVRSISSDATDSGLFASGEDYLMFTGQAPSLDPVSIMPTMQPSDHLAEPASAARHAISGEGPIMTDAVLPGGGDTAGDGPGIIVADLFASDAQDYWVHDHTQIDFSLLNGPDGAALDPAPAPAPAPEPAHFSFTVALPAMPAVDDAETPVAA
jgi:hypothetical protein